MKPIDMPYQPPSSGDRPETGTMYDRVFWLAFLANVLLVTANALTFRFAEFVKFLGGTEEITGRIVSIGLIGSLIWRAFLGQALDRFGVRKVWVSSCLVYLTGCLLIITSADVGLQIYIARVVFVIGISSMFASSVSHIQGRAPIWRRTEMIGTFGASGFLGLICGAQLGDILFNTIDESSFLYQALFGTTFVLGCLYMGLAAILTSGDFHRRPRHTPPIHKLVMRYWPVRLLIVTTIMGLGFAVTMVFLTRYSTSLGLGGIRTFFTSYAITAFSIRMLGRRWSRMVGRHRLIIFGLIGHAIGQILLTQVTQDWHFIPPAICCGFGHAMLFPCVVSLGAGAFPEQYRGTGTTVSLAAIDIGTMLTAPLLGWLIDHHGFHPMLWIACGIVTTACVLYAIFTAGETDSEMESSTNTSEKALAPIPSTQRESAIDSATSINAPQSKLR